MYPFLTTTSAAILACSPVSFLPVSTYNGTCFPLLHTVLLSLHPLVLHVDVPQHLSSCPFASLIVWLCSGPHSFQVVELLEDLKNIYIEGRTWPAEKKLALGDEAIRIQAYGLCVLWANHHLTSTYRDGPLPPVFPFMMVYSEIMSKNKPFILEVPSVRHLVTNENVPWTLIESPITSKLLWLWLFLHLLHLFSFLMPAYLYKNCLLWYRCTVSGVHYLEHNSEREIILYWLRYLMFMNVSQWWNPQVHISH